MLEKNRSAISYLYEGMGKLFLCSLFSCSMFVIIAALTSKERSDDYQERLRKAYAGLSPEEY